MHSMNPSKFLSDEENMDGRSDEEIEDIKIEVGECSIFMHSNISFTP